MTNLYLIDTGIVIREIRGVPQANALLSRLADIGVLMLSPVSVFELEAGVRSSDNPSGVIASMLSASLTHESASEAAGLMRANRGIFSSTSIADALIAGTAISYDASLVTLNTRQFGRIRYPGLELVLIDQASPDWTAEL